MSTQSGNGSEHGAAKQNEQDHNRVIASASVWQAIFAFALVLAAGAQIFVSVKQTNTTIQQYGAMRTQNWILERQLDETAKAGAQTDKALAQTDKMIEQMRLDKRPWLGIETVFIPRGPENPSNAFMYTIRNDGHTPATVIEDCTTHHYMNSGVEMPGLGIYTPSVQDAAPLHKTPNIQLKMDEVLAHSREAGCAQARGIVIAPGAERPFLKSIPVDKEFEAPINKGAVGMIVVLWIKYSDPIEAGETHETWAVFYYFPGSGATSAGFYRDHSNDHMD